MDIQENELELVQNLFRLMTRFDVDIAPETARQFELCDPEFSALRAQTQDAYASREGDIANYAAQLADRIATVSH